jgi:hypothetical protein
MDHDDVRYVVACTTVHRSQAIGWLLPVLGSRKSLYMAVSRPSQTVRVRHSASVDRRGGRERSAASLHQEMQAVEAKVVVEPVIPRTDNEITLDSSYPLEAVAPQKECAPHVIGAMRIISRPGFFDPSFLVVLVAAVIHALGLWEGHDPPPPAGPYDRWLGRRRTHRAV